MLIRMDSFRSFTDRVAHRVSGRVKGFKSLRMQQGAQDAKDPSHNRRENSRLRRIFRNHRTDKTN